MYSRLLNIVLVEDNYDDAVLIKERLKMATRDTVTVTHVDRLMTAFLSLAQGTVDVVLLDLSLPDADGLEAVRLMAKQARDVPIVVLSGNVDPHIAASAIHSGAQDFVHKDRADPEILSRTIRYAIERHHLKRALEQRVAELEGSKGRLRSLINDNADAILIVDKDGQVLFINPAGEALLGRPAAEIVNTPFGIPVDGESQNEIDVPLRDGRSIIADMRVTHTLWHGEQAYIATLRDVTERVTAERRLRIAKQTAEQANEMKSRFLANMSHELRTPLNAIIGFADLLLSGSCGALTDERHVDYVQSIADSGTHLLSLINDLLDLSKAEAGRLELNEEACDLEEVFEASLRDIAPQAEQKHLALSFECLIWEKVRADATKLRQILVNLMSNAVKFTPENGTISVRATTDQTGDILISVTDSGVGMPSEQIPRAFGAFMQIDNECSKKRNEGTGLGLALVRKLVELHDGTVSIESEVGQGTEVTVVLPAARHIVDTERLHKRPTAAS